MSDNKLDDINTEELQNESVENVEVSSEDILDEATVAPEVDGEKAADTAGAEIKKSAPAKQPEPKTKAGMINAMSLKMSKMKKADLQAAYKGMHEDTEAEETAEVEGIFEEDLTALVDSEATLSEGFRDKASVIFEAALQSKLSTHVARLEEQYSEELAEQTTAIQADLVEKVDGYLNYVVEQWMEDNKVAIESGLRTEIAENFMSALHGVFTENYIQVPDSKVDLVDEMSTKIDELEENLNAKIDDNIKLTESVNALAREAIIRESSTGLSEAQAEKLKSLVEDTDFNDAASFKAKVATIKESYFKEAKTEVIAEDTAIVEETSTSPRMAAYLKALSNT
jgi:hypothetical protein